MLIIASCPADEAGAGVGTTGVVGLAAAEGDAAIELAFVAVDGVDDLVPSETAALLELLVEVALAETDDGCEDRPEPLVFWRVIEPAVVLDPTKPTSELSDWALTISQLAGPASKASAIPIKAGRKYRLDRLYQWLRDNCKAVLLCVLYARLGIIVPFSVLATVAVVFGFGVWFWFWFKLALKFYQYSNLHFTNAQ